MSFESGTINLPVGVFVILRDLIRERIGVSFEDDKRDLLAVKLSDRLRVLGLTSFLQYYYLLKYGSDTEDEWPRLTDTLSVQETYFWREIDQVRAMVDVLIPQHVAAGRGSIRVWSAACATGEEPLSIAIALAEAGWFDRSDIVVWASDASNRALEAAKRGVYRERSFRALPPHLRQKYFTLQKDGWKVATSLQARVKYSHANLLDPAATDHLSSAHFVFCRNVFIYFSSETVSRVVGRFANCMPRPGYLFVGVSESLRRMTTTFELEDVGGAFVYVRR